MTYAYDDYVQMPTKDLYDTAVMKMAIEAAKDMYDKGQAQMENFYKTYGDFMSPFAKDMEVYGAAMNNVRQVVNDAYARGIDLFKSPEGRMIVSQLSHSVDPLWYNSARQNAKIGYAYLDAAAKLRAAGKYSEAQEMFDIARNNGVNFQDFSTSYRDSSGVNRIRMWDRPSPVEATSFQELVHPSFINIKPHLLSREEAISRVGAEYDPTYEYTGVTKADMERAMRDNLPGLIGMPGYQYYREVAKQQLQAAGISNPTEAQINEQFVQNAVAADSQIMTPLSRDRKNYYQDQQLGLQRQAKDLEERKFEWQKEREQYDSETKRIAAENKGRGSGVAGTEGYSLTESIHHDGLYNAIKNRGIKVVKLKVDKQTGKLIPDRDRDGKLQYINPDNASDEELEYAANRGNALLSEQRKFATRVFDGGVDENGKRKTKSLEDPELQEEYLNNYGYFISNNAVHQYMNSRKVNPDGSIKLSTSDIKKLQTTGSMIGKTFGARKRGQTNYNMAGIFGYDSDIYKKLNKGEEDVEAVFQLDDVSPKNIVQMFDNDGKLQIWVRGSIQYVTSTSMGGKNTNTQQDVWLPINIISERAIKNKQGKFSVSNVSINGSNRTAKETVDANYIKSVSGIKNINAAEQ